MKNHRRFLWLSALLCFFAVIGCNLLPTSTAPTTIAPEPQVARAEPEHKFKPERVSQFVFHSDVELSKKNPLLRELSDMRERIFTDLHLQPSTTLVQVHLFENRDRYEQFVHAHHPDLPKRRAFFIQNPKLGGDELLVYAYWSSDITHDLRHEITHALLHSSLKAVPIWLDEGLAQHYEMAPSGINYEHVAALQKSLSDGLKLNLARLESFDKVKQMGHPEYCESWAWVHFMMHSTPQARQVLVRYLRDLRSNARPGPLLPRLQEAVPDLDAALERHLFHIGAQQLVER